MSDCKNQEVSIIVGIVFPTVSIISLVVVMGLIARKQDKLKEIMGRIAIVQVAMLLVAVASGLVRVLMARENVISAEDCMCKVLEPQYDMSLYLVIVGLSGFVGIQMSKFNAVSRLFAASQKLKKAKISQKRILFNGLLPPFLLALSVGFGYYYLPWIFLVAVIVSALYFKVKLHSNLVLLNSKAHARFDEGEEFINSTMSAIGLGLPISITYIITRLESDIDRTISCTTLISGSLFWSISTACMCVVIAFNMYFKRINSAYNPIGEGEWEEVASDIKCGNGYSTIKNTSDALIDALQTCINQLNGGKISFVFLNFRPSDDRNVVAMVMEKILPGVPFVGGTTCLGSLSSTGFQSDSIGMFAVSDEKDSMYVTSQVEMTDEISGYDAAVRCAELLKTRTKEEMKSTPTAPKTPGVIWMISAPGCEEEQMKGIKKVYGDDVRIIGGSSADNTVEGMWFQVSSSDVRATGNGIVLAALHSSVEIGNAFFSGYSATSFNGRITEGSGRLIKKIDGQNAADVYDKWVGGALKEGLTKDKRLNVLGKTTLYPIGIQAGESGVVEVGDPYYKILHPSHINDDGSIELFANIEEGQVIHCMAGTPKNLQTRIAHTVKHIMDDYDLQRSQIVGAMTIFCGGCTLAIGEKNMNIPADKLSNVLGGVPLMGCHTFGEQGQFPDGTSQHGNLMFSVMVFSNRRLTKAYVNNKTGEIKNKAGKYRSSRKSVVVSTKSRGSVSPSSNGRLNSEYYASTIDSVV
jgi:hypothetical protein